MKEDEIGLDSQALQVGDARFEMAEECRIESARVPGPRGGTLKGNRSAGMKSCGRRHMRSLLKGDADRVRRVSASLASPAKAHE